MRLLAALSLLLATAVPAASGAPERFAAQAARIAALDPALDRLVLCVRSGEGDACRRDLDLDAGAYGDAVREAADEQEALLALAKGGRADFDAVLPAARRAALSAHALSQRIVLLRSELHDSLGWRGPELERHASRLEELAAETCRAK